MPVGFGLFLLATGFLTAQRGYRGVELPPQIQLPGVEEDSGPAEFYFARLAYSDLYGGQDLPERPWQIDSPAAERHLLQGLKRLSNVDGHAKERYVRASDEDFFFFPFLYAVEPGHWDLTDAEAERVREYLLRGGFMMFDDFHGSTEWAYFMRGMRLIFPDRPVVKITPDQEIFHVLYDLDHNQQIPGIQMLYTGRSYEKDGVTPEWHGVYDDDGRLMVLIGFNMDLGDAWEHAEWPEYPERYTAMSYRLAINYVLYAMTH